MQIRRQRPRTAANGFEKQDEASEAFKDIIIKYNIINDMTRHKLSGAGAAIPTPFTPDGRVDYPALARTIDYIIDGGVDFIVALGTTAETPTLYLHERAVVAMFIKNHIAGRVPLVIGVGGNSTSEVLDQLREFDLRGADAILSVTPYYNKPSQEGLYQHFKTVSEHSPLPIILYNVPGRTGVNMTAATTIRIAGDFPNVIGIKEASGKIDQIQEILDWRSRDFLVLSGRPDARPDEPGRRRRDLGSGQCLPAQDDDLHRPGKEGRLRRSTQGLRMSGGGRDRPLRRRQPDGREMRHVGTGTHRQHAAAAPFPEPRSSKPASKN